MRLTNLAQQLPDNVNLPTLRGLLSTDDGAVVWVELDGVATLRPEDGARVFVTTCRFGADHEWKAGADNDAEGRSCDDGYAPERAVAGRSHGRGSTWRTWNSKELTSTKRLLP